MNNDGNGLWIMGRGVVLVVCGVVAVTPDARAQATEAATPVAVATWRIDADVYARAEDWRMPAGWGGRSSTEASWLQVATGVADRMDVQLGWQAYQKVEADGVRAEGVGDVFLAAKWRIAGDETEGAAWAVMPYVKLPTAGDRFADDTVDAGALLIFGAPLGEEGAGYVNAQIGWDDYGDGAGGRDRGASASVVAGRYLGERWTVYGEALAGMYPLNGDSDAVAFSVGGGVTWAGDASGSWGAGLAAYGAATRAAPDLLAAFRIWVEWGAVEPAPQAE